MRQDEPLLIDAVRECALGEVSLTTDAFLQSLSRPLSKITRYTKRLCAVNKEVRLHNLYRLRQLDTQEKVYTSIDQGDDSLLAKMVVEKVCSNVSVFSL